MGNDDRDWDEVTTPVERPQTDPGRLLVVRLIPSDDPVLTCVICCEDNCDMSFLTRVGRSGTGPMKNWSGAHGIHSSCADTIEGTRNDG